MPIPMTDDPQDPDQNDDQGGEGGGGRSNFPGGGGGGGLLSLLPLLFSLCRGKGIIVLLILGGGAYFLMGRGGCNMSQLTQLATGRLLDPVQFRKAAIHEPLLADDPNNPPLPASVNLQKFAPVAGNQGQQGSCIKLPPGEPCNSR